MTANDVINEWEKHGIIEKIFDNYWMYHTEHIGNAFKDIDSLLATGKYLNFLGKKAGISRILCFIFRLLEIKTVSLPRLLASPLRTRMSFSIFHISSNKLMISAG